MIFKELSHLRGQLILNSVKLQYEIGSMENTDRVLESLNRLPFELAYIFRYELKQKN